MYNSEEYLSLKENFNSSSALLKSENGIITIDKENGTIEVTIDLHYGPGCAEAMIEGINAQNYSDDKKASLIEAVENVGYVDDNLEWTKDVVNLWEGPHEVTIEGETYQVTCKVNIVEHQTFAEAKAAWLATPTSNLLYTAEGRSVKNSYSDYNGRGYMKIEPSTINKGDGVTFTHEIGHALGLPHYELISKCYKRYDNGPENTYAAMSYAHLSGQPRSLTVYDIERALTPAVKLALESDDPTVKIELYTFNAEPYEGGRGINKFKAVNLEYDKEINWTQEGELQQVTTEASVPLARETKMKP